MVSPKLNPEKALIFRIVHIKNIPWMLDNAIHSQNSKKQDPNYIQIGNPELILKRKNRPVDTAPGGVLGDYIPFYFTPYSMMMFNIITGHNVAMQKKEDLVILVSSMHKIAENKIPFLFTNQHGYLSDTIYYNDLSKLDDIDWQILRMRDFKYDVDDPAKQARYQAEALVIMNYPKSL